MYDTLFWQQSIAHNTDVQYQVAGSHTSEKVWDFTLLPCGVGGLVDGLTTALSRDYQNFSDWIDNQICFARARVGLHNDFTYSMLKANRWVLLKKLEKVELN